jgi:hypothetical protein
VYSCLSLNVHKRNIIFWGNFMIYSSQTTGKSEARRQSEVIMRARHTNIAVPVAGSVLPSHILEKWWLKYMYIESTFCKKMETVEIWRVEIEGTVERKTALKRIKLYRPCSSIVKSACILYSLWGLFLIQCEINTHKNFHFVE